METAGPIASQRTDRQVGADKAHYEADMVAPAEIFRLTTGTKRFTIGHDASRIMLDVSIGWLAFSGR